MESVEIEDVSTGQSRSTLIVEGNNPQISMNPKVMIMQHMLKSLEKNADLKSADCRRDAAASKSNDLDDQNVNVGMGMPKPNAANQGGVDHEDEKENNDGIVNTFSFTHFVNICKSSKSKVPISDGVSCASEECERKAVPMNAFCVKHIGADKSQCLFQSCKARHTDFSLCDATIVPSVLTSLLDNNQIYDSGQAVSDKTRCTETTKNDVQTTASTLGASIVALCLEHRLKLEQANKLKNEPSSKMTVLQRAAAKHERKLKRIEKRNKKLALKKEKELLRSQKKPRVSATVRVWAKRRRKKQPTVIQTGGKRINNIPYRPYPDYEWRYSSSQSSSSVSEFSDGYISEDQTVSIKTFSQDDEPSTRTPNDDSLCQGEEESKSMFDNTANDQCSENPSHKTIPPRREALTPELSDDSLQGLEVPGCFDSPMFDSPISDSCFDKYFNEFFDEVQLGHRETFQPIEAPVSECNILPTVVSHDREDIASLDKMSGALVIVEESPDKINVTQEAPKTKEDPNEIRDKKQTGDSMTLDVFEQQQEQEKDGMLENHAIEDTCEIKCFNEHDYTAFSRHKKTRECPNQAIKDHKEMKAPEQLLRTETFTKVQHPNKWLRLNDSVANDQPIKSGFKVDSNSSDFKKKDPILCQPKADALDVVRVKFRAPIVERGGDRFITVPPIKRRKKQLTQHGVTDPNLSKPPSK